MLRQDGERGQGMVEYALILVLIVVIVIVILMVMGNTVKNMYCNVSGSLNV
ncbi:MAG: Flp family type IVb pilin [Chloroflexi bacterium]|nr:MAG: Flp family type IVb pilin [Chloroflexota bacterium]TMG39688.1 MAG: Flp family type IVb pilin [Chloroflexota bacterium]